MMTRTSRAHAVAGTLALTLIALFFTSSVVVETVGDRAAILVVKTAILFALLVLVPAMIVTGASGRRAAGRMNGPLIRRKKKRMIAVAAVGVLVLIPCAVTLQRLAAHGSFDAAFYAVQAVELAGGAVNITLMSLNVRAGRMLTRRKRQQARQVPVPAGS